jgi:hypothetical protein
MFLVYFYETASLTYFRGQTDYVVHFEEKLSWTKIRSILPKMAPKSFFRKTRFLSIFTKPPPHLFSGKTDNVECFKAKLSWTNSLAFA